ncbi:hypothetical protein BG28_12710 [Nesterenkonia sp. AN1]|nr:hypothetical protein BG28_12710 [Nesterenkonia sp. AN1]
MMIRSTQPCSWVAGCGLEGRILGDEGHMLIILQRADAAGPVHRRGPVLTANGRSRAIAQLVERLVRIDEIRVRLHSAPLFDVEVQLLHGRDQM